jgi:hypothetical protein
MAHRNLSRQLMVCAVATTTLVGVTAIGERPLARAAALSSAPPTRLTDPALEPKLQVQPAHSSEGAAYRPLMLNDHPRVRRSVVYFSQDSGGHRLFQQWLDRAAGYAAQIRSTLDAAGLPPELLAVAMIESGMDPCAVSPAGATGMWQFVEDTARSYGLVLSEDLDQRRSPGLATRAAASYLRDLYDRFGDWPLALAGYNAGEARVQQWLDETQSHDFWSLAVHASELAEETLNYVPKVLAAAAILRNPELYGFRPLTPQPPEAATSVVVAPSTPLSRVALALSLPLEELRRLNPELLRDSVPSALGANTLRIPEHRAELAELLLDPLDSNTSTRLLNRLEHMAMPEFTLATARCFPSSCYGTNSRADWKRMQAVMVDLNHHNYRPRPGDPIPRVAVMLGVEPGRLTKEGIAHDPSSLREDRRPLVPTPAPTL